MEFREGGIYYKEQLNKSGEFEFCAIDGNVDLIALAKALIKRPIK